MSYIVYSHHKSNKFPYGYCMFPCVGTRQILNGFPLCSQCVSCAFSCGNTMFPCVNIMFQLGSVPFWKHNIPFWECDAPMWEHNVATFPLGVPIGEQILD